MTTIMSSLVSSLYSLTMSTTNDESLTCEEEEMLNVLYESRKRNGVKMDLWAIQARFEPDRWAAVERTCVQKYDMNEDGSLAKRCELMDLVKPRPPDYEPFRFLNENQHICWLNTIIQVDPPPPLPPLSSSSIFDDDIQFTSPTPFPHRLSVQVLLTMTMFVDQLTSSKTLEVTMSFSYLFVLHHASI